MDEPIDAAPEGAARNDPGDITYKTETLRRGNDDMRKRIAELRDTLQMERARVRDAHVDKVTSLKKQRDMDEVSGDELDMCVCVCACACCSH